MDINFISFIKPELLILIPVLFITGKILKKTEDFKDNNIPITLGGISIALSIIYSVSITPVYNIQQAFGCMFTAITQGILIAGTTVYTDQIIKQMNDKK